MAIPNDDERSTTLARALEGLAAPDALTRLEAAEALGALADAAAVEPLIGALADRSAVVRWAVAMALLRLGDPRAIEPLVAILPRQSPIAQHDILKGIRVFCTAAVPALAQALAEERDDFYGNGTEIIRLLDEIGDPRALPALVDALGSPIEHVRRWAKPAVLSFGEAAREPLLGALVSENAEARWYASEALPYFGRELFFRFIAILYQGPADSQADVLDVLGRIRDARAIPFLADFVVSEDAELRKWAAVSLGRLGDTLGLSILVERLGESSHDWQLMEGLAGISAAAVPALISALGDHTAAQKRRVAIIDALAEIGGPDAVVTLRRALADDHSMVGDAARSGLRELSERMPLDDAIMKEIEADEDAQRRQLSLDRYLATLLDETAPRIERVRAAGRLSALRAPQRRPVLSRIIADPATPLESETFSLACQALHPFDDAELRTLITRMEAASYRMRTMIAQAIARTVDARVREPDSRLAWLFEPMLAALRSGECCVQRSAVWVLKALRDPRAVAPLLDGLETEEDEGLRQGVIAALGAIGDRRALAPLMRLEERLPDDPKLFDMKATCVDAILSLLKGRALGESAATLG